MKDQYTKDYNTLKTIIKTQGSFKTLGMYTRIHTDKARHYTAQRVDCLSEWLRREPLPVEVKA